MIARTYVQKYPNKKLNNYLLPKNYAIINNL